MNENKDIKSLVLDKIHEGKICMRPRFHFVFKVFALMSVAILTLLVSSLLASFIIFSLMTSGKLLLLGFGFRGFVIFFTIFPWFLLIIEIVLIILLEWLLKKFKLGYRSSFTTLILIIFLFSTVIGIIIDVTPLHSTLLHRAEKRNLPIVGEYYRVIRRPPPGEEVFRGRVSEVGTSSFILYQAGDEDDEQLDQYFVIFLPMNSPNFLLPTVGETVFVAGHFVSSSTIQAYGFKRITAD